MDEDYFNKYTHEAKIKPNPSNQNFHLKIIKALSLKANIEVISLRPFTKKMFDEYTLEEMYGRQGEINFYYVKESSTLLDRFLSLNNDICELADDLLEKDSIIVVDTMNEHLLKSALKIKKKYGIKVIGVLSDNPANISHTNKRYIDEIYKNIVNLDGYIYLTNGLNTLFNKNNKPSFQLIGLVDEYKPITNPEKDPYIFFGGALYERYGVLDMVNAYLKSGINDNLIIAGHGDLDAQLNELMKSNPKIKYLGIISKEQMYAYEQHAVICINPRRYDKKLDEESIPSKVLEYASNKANIISSKSTDLMMIFGDAIKWIGEQTELIESLKNMNTAKSKKGTSAYEIAQKFTIENKADELYDFVASFSNSKI